MLKRKNGESGGIRIPGPQIRNLLLYPAELHSHLVREVGFKPTHIPPYKEGALFISATRGYIYSIY